jgi:hypothetical protein
MEDRGLKPDVLSFFVLNKNNLRSREV